MLLKNKIQYLLFFCFLSCNSFLAFGQQRKLNHPPNAKIRALKIQVVTKNMDLTPAQRTQFLPLYNRYSNELLVVYREKHALKRNENSNYVVSERLRLDQQIVSIKTKYQSIFLKVISPKQLEKMYRGEDEFKKLLIERLRHKD